MNDVLLSLLILCLICVFQLNVDVNAFQRKFVSEVRRCDELERKLRYIEAEINKDSVPIPDIVDSPFAPNPREIIDLEVRMILETNSCTFLWIKF